MRITFEKLRECNSTIGRYTEMSYGNFQQLSRFVVTFINVK